MPRCPDGKLAALSNAAGDLNILIILLHNSFLVALRAAFIDLFPEIKKIGKCVSVF